MENKQEYAIDKPINKIKIGDISDLGKKITQIYYRNNDYIIYSTDNHSNVAYTTSDITKYNNSDILKQLIYTTNLIDDKDRKKYSNRIASAYKECFDGNSKNAITILKSIDKIAERRKTIKNRLVYLLSASLFVILNIVISVIMFLINTDNETYKTIFNLFLIATFGSIGGIMSISLRIKTLNLEVDGKHFIHITNAIFRIFISMLSSIVIYEVIKANILLGILNQGNENHFYVFAVLSGFSETFIPNLLKSIENNVENNEKDE